MNSFDWTSRNYYGATFITGLAPCDAFVRFPSDDGYARTRDKATDEKVIAKILPDIPAKLMVIIKHNEGYRSQL
jgi:hypothetical protein